MKIRDMGKAQYKPVDHCIYCGATDNLSREHIIPFGLSGTAVLPKSSCQICAEITGKLEMIILRGELRSARIFRELQSRRKHKGAPSVHPITFIINDEYKTCNLAIEEYPILLHFPVFSLPAYITNESYSSGISIQGVVTVNFGESPKNAMEKFGATQISQTVTNHPAEFARVIAKIGYAMAYAEGYIECISGSPYVLPAILGESEDIGRWVGTIPEKINISSNLLHRIVFKRDYENNLLIAEVQLFSDSFSPTYCVILGSLKTNIAS